MSECVTVHACMHTYMHVCGTGDRREKSLSKTPFIPSPRMRVFLCFS